MLKPYRIFEVNLRLEKWLNKMNVQTVYAAVQKVIRRRRKVVLLETTAQRMNRNEKPDRLIIKEDARYGSHFVNRCFNILLLF